ncbi:sugar nucleotide-binding protein [Clostridium sp. 'White wine YQ']|uniref:sugar nucleotide-binding protein n=1 Tax=Clostridium sp. 'White wine YQ' TaxID=3027474 RepID=UPI00236552F3|nr:sugar nucleotide-binding protein [Clostridium sp. 'White wine YQ']MDD7792778.1 sugar nucleotide-binding protein [Clostridium sp. 'White wine YQ']
MVLDGERNTTLIETNIVSPQTVYGSTKLKGKILVSEYNSKHYIIRIAWRYGDGNNCVKTMLKLSETNKVLKVISDKKGTLTSTVDLARVIIKLIENKTYGLYFCTCKCECTWHELTKEMFK